jgi:hypothetical protein
MISMHSEESEGNRSEVNLSNPSTVRSSKSPISTTLVLKLEKYIAKILTDESVSIRVQSHVQSREIKATNYSSLRNFELRWSLGEGLKGW